MSATETGNGHGTRNTIYCGSRSEDEHYEQPTNGYQPTRGRVIKDAVGLCRGFVVGEVMSPSEDTKLVEAIPELRNV
mgnify:CR=1 FL=1